MCVLLCMCVSNCVLMCMCICISMCVFFLFFLFFFVFVCFFCYPRNNNKYGGVRDGALISPPYTCIMYSHTMHY